MRTAVTQTAGKPSGGELFYRVTLPDGSMTNLAPYQVWHVQALSTDGIKGLSVISQAREAIGLGIASEEFAARYFGQGTNIGGIVEYPGKLSVNTKQAFKDDIQNTYEGLGRVHRLMFLEEGMKYQQIGLKPEDVMMIQTRTFQLEDVARWFGVQPHLVGDSAELPITTSSSQG